ncbi:hypothetical protein A0H81_10507 [Grifola frondosa]|uniref:Uncharacterized protein n=1 Tax=Grifola frondosa TaxID=5627 RepID=A0A1C7LZ40_GRIFR|nr:hypothetical protein A0H81_10507 [Grifola frondosa]
MRAPTQHSRRHLPLRQRLLYRYPETCRHWSNILWLTIPSKHRYRRHPGESGQFDNYRDCLSSKLFMSLFSRALNLYLMVPIRCCHHTPPRIAL